MIITVSRAEALVHARYVYRGLALRAWDSAPDDRDYIADLAKAWDQRLAELVGSSDELRADETLVLDRLTSSVSHPDLSRDAILEWVDAFPAAISDLLGATGDAEAEEGTRVVLRKAERAANKQPALALAA